MSCQAIYPVEWWPCSSCLRPVYFPGAPYLIGPTSGTWTAPGSATNASTVKSPSRNLVNCKDISEYTPVSKIIKCLCIIKSPRSGVTLCFQFVSAVSASAAAKTFPSHVKTVWAKPLIFGTKDIWVWGNVLDDLSMTLTQGHGCGVD